MLNAVIERHGAGGQARLVANAVKSLCGPGRRERAEEVTTVEVARAQRSGWWSGRRWLVASRPHVIRGRDRVDALARQADGQETVA